LSSAQETTRPDWFGAREEGHPSAELSAYFLELERLLERIESSTTHYQVLGLDRSAAREHVDQSYQHALSLIYPQYIVGATVPPNVTARVEDAFKRASLAFSVLAGFVRRREYDRTLLSHPQKGQEAAPPSRARVGFAAEDSVARPEPQTHADGGEIAVSRLRSQPAVYAERGRTVSSDNRRRCERMKLSMPARAMGFDRKSGKWNEMSETVDVSRTGLTLRMKRRVRHGNVLYLTLPMPIKLRSHGYSEPHYSVYTLVRRVEPARQGVRVVGLEFLGEHPPAGFLEKPWAVFRTRKWDGRERRRAPRIKTTEMIRIEYFSEGMQLLASEEARTEDVSRTGLRVAVRAAPAEFDLVRVSCSAYGFEALAAASNRFTAKDGVERLCVHFLEKEWPV
jgi:hypothetical protein